MKGSKGQGYRRRGGGEAWRRDSFSRGMLANVLTYKERTSLTGERMRGNKEHHHPSANGRKRKKGDRSKGLRCIVVSRRGERRREVSY